MSNVRACLNRIAKKSTTFCKSLLCSPIFKNQESMYFKRNIGDYLHISIWSPRYPKGFRAFKKYNMPQLTEPLKWQDMFIFSPRPTRDSFQSYNCTNLFSVLMTIHWTKIPVKVVNFTGHDLIKSTKENSVAVKDIVVRSMYHACLSRVVWRVDRLKLINKGQT